MAQDRATPAYEFGYGLGYTTWKLDNVDGPTNPVTPDEVIPVTVTLTNTGERAGKQVVQLYAEKKDSAVERPVRWFVASTPIWAQPGETVTTTIEVPTRLLAYWDNGWSYETGDYKLLAGFSVNDLQSKAAVVLEP